MTAAHASGSGLVDWGQRPAEAGKLYGKLSGNSDHQAQSAPKGAQLASKGAQGAPS